MIAAVTVLAVDDGRDGGSAGATNSIRRWCGNWKFSQDNVDAVSSVATERKDLVVFAAFRCRCIGCNHHCAVR